MITIHHYQNFRLLMEMSNDQYLKAKYTRPDKEFKDLANFSMYSVLEEEYLFKIERLPYSIRLHPSDDKSEHDFNAKYSDLLNKAEIEHEELVNKCKTNGHINIPYRQGH